MNRVFVVTQGFSLKPNAPWFVAERKPNGSLRRVRSDHLPMTATKQECENNLLYWLWIHCTTPTDRRQCPFDDWLSAHGGREKVLSEGVSVWAFKGG